MIEFINFSFRYEVQAEPTVKNINLKIKRGEKVLLAGPSGSGKSTLGQVINGLIPHHHQGQMTGDFLIQGKPVFDLSVYEKSQLVSTVLQDMDGQFIGLSVAEDIAFALENDQLNQAEMTEKVSSWAQRLQLTKLLDHRPQDLSGGQKQRVSLAGVLVDESPILLFDEPLANLDPKTSQDMLAVIDQIHRDHGLTTIIIEHRLEEVLASSVDRVVLMDEGQIVFDGSPDDLLAGSLLTQHGIREPLYITSLRDLGVDLSGQKRLSQLEQMEVKPKPLPDFPKVEAMADKDDLLTIKDLTVAYQAGQPILDRLSLAIKKGERLAIVGRNGAGKSTLAKALCQFVPSSGQLRYQGQDISDDSIKERAERIGYVLQNPNQMISQTMIFDEVALGLRLRQVDEAEVSRRVAEVLKVCGLYAFRKWPISALSFGQKKRVTIASILVLNPEIILLDEPTAGQDWQHYREMMAFLDQLNQAGHTIVMITHDMQLMLEYSDRTLVLADGKVIAEGHPFDMLNDLAVVEAANLKQTSLFDLAGKLGVEPRDLTQYYMSQRRGQDGWK
nr:ABC transporter ATP-binding protein [Streptococcus cuniculipharyngis]